MRVGPHLLHWSDGRLRLVLTKSIGLRLECILTGLDGLHTTLSFLDSPLGQDPLVSNLLCGLPFIQIRPRHR